MIYVLLATDGRWDNSVTRVVAAYDLQEHAEDVCRKAQAIVDREEKIGCSTPFGVEPVSSPHDPKARLIDGLATMYSVEPTEFHLDPDRSLIDAHVQDP